MNVDPRRSYTAKVSLGLLVVLVVGAGVGAYTYQAVSEEVRASQTTAIESQADVHGSLVETHLSNHREDTETTGRLLARFQLQSGSGQTQRIRTLLSNEAADSRAALRYLYADADTGEILVSNEVAYEGGTLAEYGYGVPASIESVGDTAVAFRSDGQPRWVFYTDTGTGRVLVKEVSAAVLSNRVERIVSGSRTRVVNEDGVVVLDTGNASAVGTRHTPSDGVSSPAVNAAVAGENGTMHVSAADAGSDNDSVAGYASVDGVPWGVVSYTSPANLYAVAGETGRSVVVLLAALAVLLAGFAVVVERPTLRALGRLEADADALADGDLDREIASPRRDEIGAVFGSLESMRGDIRERIRQAEAAREEAERAEASARERREEAAAATERVERMNDHLESKAAAYEAAMASVADGDLTVRVDPDSDHDAVQSMGEQFNAVLDDLEATVREVQSFADVVAASTRDVTDSAADISAASDEVSQAVEGISEGTAEQRALLEDVADQTDELSASVAAVAETADDVAATASETAALGERGREAATEAVDAIESVEGTADDAVEAVEALVERVDGVVGVVDAIRDVADRTNVLALNASIEAARAEGGDGGFAVVAEEVKALAEQSRERADEVDAELAAIREQTQATADRMRSAREELTAAADEVSGARTTFESVVSNVEETDAGVADIDEATTEQADRTREAARGVSEATDVAADTAAEAESVAATAERQSETVDSVTDAVESLRAQAEDLERALAHFETGPGATGAAVSDAPAARGDASEGDGLPAVADGDGDDEADVPGERRQR